MSLGLHAKCLGQLKEKVARGLKEARAIHRIFLESWSVSVLKKADETLPRDARQKLEAYIGESAVAEFIDGRLSKELQEGQKYDSSSPDAFPLTELEGYKDPSAVAERLVQEFESLPWEYAVALRVRNDFGELLAREVKDFRLSEAVRIAEVDEEFRKAFPVHVQGGNESSMGSLAAALLDPSEKAGAWAPGFAYLQIKVEGFIGYYGVTAPLQRAIDAVKTFFGLGIALGMLKRSYSLRHRVVRARSLIHRRGEQGWCVERTFDWKADASAVLDDLVLDGRGGPLVGEGQIGWVRRCLDAIGSVLREGQRAERISLAAQWLFDSHCGDNELLAFVQTTVAMEILLGDKAASDDIGVGRLLSNRCAYLIGKGQRDRESVMEEFSLMYDVRSRIVHRGKSRLSEKERELFRSFRHMCHRVIQEEINLLRTDQATEIISGVMWGKGT